jgi:hypothetical protein
MPFASIKVTYARAMKNNTTLSTREDARGNGMLDPEMHDVLHLQSSTQC